VPSFSLQERDLAWIPKAPVVIDSTFNLAASASQVFDLLADLSSWSEWYSGMRKVRIDGAASGPGALRTVWLGATRVQERFVVWEPGHRLTFTLTQSNAPGLHSMVEDWVVMPDHADPVGRAILTTKIGVDAARLLRPFPGLVRAALKGPLKGAVGIKTKFP
jgi:hypothetical protein